MEDVKFTSYQISRFEKIRKDYIKELNDLRRRYAVKLVEATYPFNKEVSR